MDKKKPPPAGAGGGCDLKSGFSRYDAPISLRTTTTTLTSASAAKMLAMRKMLFISGLTLQKKSTSKVYHCLFDN
jgi:hypothetical protein